MLLFLQNIAGWMVANWKIVLTAVGVIALIVAVLSVRGCLEDRRIERTRQKVNELKKREAEIEDAGRVLEQSANRAEAESNIAKQKVEEAQKAVDEIKREEGVSTEEAIKNLCEIYDSEICK